ncbi:MAG TPA: hypothetical protein VFA57_08785 [Pseudolabrys sp.]|jgi:hypothetical protein|nr:hypothetical protein [Pseudolabrys sp.]
MWRRHVLVLAALLLLAGCANGDFREVRPDLVTDGIHDWLDGEALADTNIPPSTFTLTDDERQLRDLAYPLIEQPYDRQQWYSVAGEYGVLRTDHRSAFDRTAYATHLLDSRYRSPASRYDRLIDDIRNDATRLPAFFETAARVLDIDQKRRKSLDYVSALSADERDQALRRIHSNAAIVDLVRRSLAHRLESYRFALERLVIVTPSQQAVDAERTLNHLQSEIAYYETHKAPTWVREQSLSDAR